MPPAYSLIFSLITILAFTAAASFLLCLADQRSISFGASLSASMYLCAANQSVDQTVLFLIAILIITAAASFFLCLGDQGSTSFGGASVSAIALPTPDILMSRTCPSCLDSQNKQTRTCQSCGVVYADWYAACSRSHPATQVRPLQPIALANEHSPAPLPAAMSTHFDVTAHDDDHGDWQADSHMLDRADSERSHSPLPSFLLPTSFPSSPSSPSSSSSSSSSSSESESADDADDVGDAFGLSGDMVGVEVELIDCEESISFDGGVYVIDTSGGSGGAIGALAGGPNNASFVIDTSGHAGGPNNASFVIDTSGGSGGAIAVQT